MRKRFKLVRIVDGKYLSANTPDPDRCLEYRVGEITKARGRGIACYKAQRYADTPRHIDETSAFFNKGNPIALIELEPIGKPVWRAVNYRKDAAYEGGINYRAVRVVRIVRTIGGN